MHIRPLATVWRVLSETMRRWSNNDGNLLAASMAYYAAFSFFPLLLVLIAGLGFALEFSNSAKNSERELLSLLSKNVAPALADQVGNILDGVRTNATVTGPVGLLTLLFGAIAIFTQLDYAFDRLWRVPSTNHAGLWGSIRRALGARLKAFLILSAMGLLIITAFVVGISMSAFETWAARWQGGSLAWSALEFTTGLVFHGAVFTVLYKAMPKPKVALRNALIGGFSVALVWEIGRHAMSYIIVGKNYTPYGVVGSFIAIMVWVYYASSLLFLGAQLVEVLEKPDEDLASGAPAAASPTSAK